jgi:sugar porter (SP) family MFS transporter
MLKLMGLLYFVSALGSALAWDWYSFLIFRFIGGLGVGGASVLSPIYIAEISPPKDRGKLVALAQFNIVLGILLAYISNYIVTLCGLGDAEWRWMFGVEALPAAAFFVFLFGNPYSPRWLMGKERKDEALKVLCKLEGDPELAKTEQAAIQESLDLEHHKINERFYSEKYLFPIMLACAIAAFNQLSGINALIYYGPRIFKMAGAGGGSALIQSAIIGLVNLVFTMAALAVIDKMGRKKLMLLGSIGYILSLGLAAWTFTIYSTEFNNVSVATEAIQKARESGVAGSAMELLKNTETEAIAAIGAGGSLVLISLIVFIASHAFGQGAVVWVFISEIFPNRVRARGQALGAFTLWIFNAAVSQTFPMIAGKFGGGTIFATYCGFMVIQLLWVVFLMPETKGVPLEDIQKLLKIE